MSRITTAVVIALLLAACHGDAIPRSRWEAMSQTGKVLAVRSMMGHQQVANSKGGAPVPEYSKPVESYVAAIDAKYAAGDARTANEIWNELADGNPASGPRGR